MKSCCEFTLFFTRIHASQLACQARLLERHRVVQAKLCTFPHCGFFAIFQLKLYHWFYIIWVGICRRTYNVPHLKKSRPQKWPVKEQLQLQGEGDISFRVTHQISCETVLLHLARAKLRKAVWYSARYWFRSVELCVWSHVQQVFSRRQRP